MHPVAWVCFAIFGGIVLQRVIKKLISDPHKDLMFVMGPKEGGKSELLAAIKREPFDPNRTGTGACMDAPGNDDTFSYGENKTFCTMESGGEGNLMEAFSQKVADYISSKRPEYVLLTLVVDVKTISVDTINSLGVYLNHFKDVCEEDNKWWQHVVQFDRCKYFSGNYQKGRWGYTIVGTHVGIPTQREEKALEGLGRSLQERGYAGRLRWVKGVGLFELSERKQRDRVICWVAEKLKQLHKTNSR